MQLLLCCGVARLFLFSIYEVLVHGSRAIPNQTKPTITNQLRIATLKTFSKTFLKGYLILNKFSVLPMASENSTNHCTWHPGNIINCSQLTKGYVCLVINRKVTIPKEIVVNLWENAEYRCTVDGGTNRWREFLLTHEIGNQLKLPDFITGDFDSITEETSNYFNNSSIQRIHTPDQNYTDFTKAIHFLEPIIQAKGINDVIVFHDTSGRLDHIMANIQTLFKAKPSLNVYLLGGSSMTWLLRTGLHTIHIPKDLVDNHRWCALLPVGGKAIVTSSGLKWNLNLSVLEFGDGIVSSSNTYSCETVHIENTNSILWSMGVFNFHDD